MKIIKIYDRKSYLTTSPYLNIRQLLNPIFYNGAWPIGAKKHPNMDRQHSRRQRSKDLAAARRLKTQYVPLCKVVPPDPPDPPEWREQSYDFGELVHVLSRALDTTMGRRM